MGSTATAASTAADTAAAAATATALLSSSLPLSFSPLYQMAAGFLLYIITSLLLPTESMPLLLSKLF